MKHSNLPKLLVLALAVGGMMAQTGSAVTVITDDFDTGIVSPAWDLNTGTTVNPGGPAGSVNFVTLATVTGALGESFHPATSTGAEDFIIDFNFRVRATANRQFNLMVSDFPTTTAPSTATATLNLRQQNGLWGVFDSGAGTFVNVPGLPGATAGDWYHMQVEGVDWGLPTASYTLRLSDANSQPFTSTVSGLTSQQNEQFLITANPAHSFTFNAAFGTNPGWDLDSVTATVVPEPAGILLYGLGVLGILLRRRA